MSSDLVQRPLGTPALKADTPTHGSVVRALAAAGERLRILAETVDAIYESVGGGAEDVTRLADQMAREDVDADTIAGYYEAAGLMGGALDAANAMADALADLSGQLTSTAEQHRREYGPVAEAVRSMPVQMAKPGFYATH